MGGPDAVPSSFPDNRVKERRQGIANQITGGVTDKIFEQAEAIRNSGGPRPVGGTIDIIA